MKTNGQDGLESFKILVDGENDKVMVGGHGADEKIGVRTWNSLAARQVMVAGSQLEVFRGGGKIGKSAEMLPQLLEMVFRFHSGEDLLPDSTDE